MAQLRRAKAPGLAQGAGPFGHRLAYGTLHTGLEGSSSGKANTGPSAPLPKHASVP